MEGVLPPTELHVALHTWKLDCTFRAAYSALHMAVLLRGPVDSMSTAPDEHDC
jgi:hypothetical protein